MSVTLSEVKRAARAHRAPLAGESAGYLVLAIADQVLGAPRLVQAADVQLTEDGAVRVLSGHASSDVDAELSLRRALEQLLLVASSGSAALSRAARRTAPIGLSALVHELEAALIPVNRAAARRALARIQRETARALASGVLPGDDPAPVANAQAPAEAEAADVPQGISAGPNVVPSVEPQPEPPEASIEESDALTIALEVRSVTPVEARLDFEADMVFEPDFLDPGEVLSVLGAHEVEVEAVTPSVAETVREQGPLEPASDACTRPEPIVLRRSLQPEPLARHLVPLCEELPRTPALGSLAAALPRLSAERIAELSGDASRAIESQGSPAEAPLIDSAQHDECTEQMPEVAPLSPGVALVLSRQSDVSELLSSFQVAPAPGDSNQGLRRAIKEMAELDLTPAPFAALIR
jgi:hypothetical protein